MKFSFTYSPNVTLEQIQGFELAGKVWSTYLNDNVTINIAVDTQSDFPGNAIAGAAPRLNTQGFASYRTPLEKDATSANDRIIAQSNNIMSSGSFTGRFDLFDASGTNRGTTQTSPQLNVNSANAKAVGLKLAGDSSILDGYVVMRNLSGQSVSWNYDFARTAPAPSKTLDFLSTAIHEIGHILGFQSSVDRPGWLSPRNNGNKSAETDYIKSLDARTKGATPLDLFRYSDRSKLNVDKNGKQPVDLSMGGNPFLSIQNGNSPVASFDTGSNPSLGGSGLQASHWKSGGIMNAVLSQGARPAVTSADLTALDAIGYDLAPQGASTPINYAQLLSEVNQSLAQKLGQTVAWLQANPTTAVSRLTQDTTDMVSDMLNSSSVYKKKDLTVWTSGGRGGRWWQDFKQTFMEEGVFESLGDHDHDHDQSHEEDLSGTVDPLTGLPMEGAIAGETSSDNGSLMSFEGAQTYDFAVMDLMNELGLGDLGQSLFDRGILASWVNQNLNGLVNADLFSNSTNGSEQGIIGGNVI
jgi:hypothetical protein